MTGSGESFRRPEPTRGRDARISSVVGRAEHRAIPEFFSGELTDGLSIQMPKPQGERTELKTWSVQLTRLELSECPICGAADPTTIDHVPPDGIGGRPLVTTCARCNNEFGSRYEAEFKDWYELALPPVRFEGDTVPGARKAGRYLYRETPEGEFVLFGVGGGDPAVQQVLEGGRVSMHGRDYDMAAVTIAAAKTVYLIACAILGTVPVTKKARALRAELVAARDLPRRSSLKLGPVASRVTLARTAEKPIPGEVAFLTGKRKNGAPIRAIGLNRFVGVDWPLEPGLFDRMLISLKREGAARSAGADA